MDKTDVIFLLQDSQGISTKTVGNIKTLLKKMMPKLNRLRSDFNFAVAKYATSRQMSCFGSADETVSYMDNEYQHGGSGLNLLSLALSKMVLKQFEKRPDDRTEDTTKVSLSFGYFLLGQKLCDQQIQAICVISGFYQNWNQEDRKFGEITIKTRSQLYNYKTRNLLQDSRPLFPKTVV